MVVKNGDESHGKKAEKNTWKNDSKGFNRLYKYMAI